MKKSATGVIIRKEDNKFLLIKRGYNARSNHGKWFFPGGMAELGETPEQNVIREICEEVGLIFFPEKIIYEYKTSSTETTRFIGTATGHVRIQIEECDGFGWFSYLEAINLPIAFEGVEHIEYLKENGYINF